jgi:hypothetical protein
MYKVRNCPLRDGSFIQDILFTSNDGQVYSIPQDPANTDYAQFKKAVAEGAELQDADGNVMSAEAAQAYIITLP